MSHILKAIALVAAISALAPATALSQTARVTPGTPKAMQTPPTASAPAAEALVKQELPARPRQVRHRTWSKADARACLEFPSNLQIIACSHKYL